MFSLPLKGYAVTAVRVPRVLVAAAGVAAVLVAVDRAPLWLATWNLSAVVGALGGALLILVSALALAIHGSAAAVQRAATEMIGLGFALLLVEVCLLLRAPETWSENAVVQRMIATERAARKEGVAYDGRLISDVVADLRARGLDAVPGYSQNATASGPVAAAVRQRGLLPLSNAGNAWVVECNEGAGYLKYESDEFGFNNPPGLARAAIDVAVIGESLAAGHCVEPSKSVIEHVRREFPRTANFGVAGSRVLSQLAVFREYVEPLRPPVVVWFLNVNYAEARREASQPLLLNYLNDRSFAQGLRERQDEVDAFVREVVAPLTLQRDERSRDELEHGSSFPFGRVVELHAVRGLVDFDSATRREPAPDMSHLKRALKAVVASAGAWGGEVVVVVLPSYDLMRERPPEVARYRAVLDVVKAFPICVVDGAALFAAQPDALSLFTLRIDNHPGERGHALLAEAVAAAIRSRRDL